VQIELPPFSQFWPSLLLLLTLGLTAAWGWSLWLLVTGWGRVRGLPAWLWAVLLIVVPIVTAPLFLLVGAPISSRARRAAAVAAAAALVVTVGVVAIQQIGIMDCRVAHDRLTEVCVMEPRSDALPIVLGVLAAIIIGILVQRPWRTPRMPKPLAT
jgi:hypothetical protein